jgi:hypothetical protein
VARGWRRALSIRSLRRARTLRPRWQAAAPRAWARKRTKIWAPSHRAWASSAGGRCGYHSRGGRNRLTSRRGAPPECEESGAPRPAWRRDRRRGGRRRPARVGALDLPLKQLDDAERGSSASPPLIAGGYATQVDAAARIFRSVTRIHVSPAWARRSSSSAISANGFDASV